MSTDNESQNRPAADLPQSENRRRFLSTATAALGACAGGLVLLPMAGALLSPLGKRTVRLSAEPADVGAEEEFKENQPRKVSVLGSATDGWETADRELGAVWVTRQAGGKWLAFSSVCPHLGCAVDFTSDANSPYFCPCHESYFSADGAAQKGPSPRGLDALPIEVRNGRVFVEFHRYVLNQSQKVES